jgi:serine phosphatase RsbU (regulator of sigma subunit)
VSLAEDFATMLLARWDPKTGTLEYASAGHEAAWLLPSRGPPRELPSTGWLLAVHEEAAWETETLGVGPGDRLLFVTDGVTEAFDREGTLFGRERLVREFSQCRRTTVRDAVRQIDEALTAHRENKAPADDVTIVIAEFVALDT